MFVVRQLPHFTSAEWHDVNLGSAFIRGDAHVSDRESHQIAFGRDLGITSPANFQKLVNGESTLLRGCDCRKTKQANDRHDKIALHKYLLRISLKLLGKAGVLSHFRAPMATERSHAYRVSIV